MKNEIISKKMLKDKIADLEWFKHSKVILFGLNVKVVNLKLLKRSKKAVADVIIYHGRGTIYRRYYDCEYDLLELISKKE